MGSAKLNKHEHEKNFFLFPAPPTFYVPFTFASSPLSEGLEQATTLWTAGTGFSVYSSLAQVSSSQGRPAFVVSSFVRTFAAPNPSLVSFRAITASAVASQAGLRL